MAAGSSMVVSYMTSEILKKKISKFYNERSREEVHLKNIIQAINVYKSSHPDFVYYK